MDRVALEGDGFPGSPYTTTTGDDGVWSIALANDTLAHGEGPYNLSLCASSTGTTSSRCVTADDVYFGDVILCSGQSNMERDTSYIWNGTAEIQTVEDFPLLRLFQVNKPETPTCGVHEPQLDLDGRSERSS